MEHSTAGYVGGGRRVAWRQVAGQVAFMACLATAGHAGDWSQYRGPRGEGIADAADLAPSWPSDGPPEIFRRPIGAGFSSVAIVGDRLVTMEADERYERLVMLDAETGATIWSLPVGMRFDEQFGDGPRSTPSVTATHIVAASSDLQVLVATPDGEVVWQRDLGSLFGSPQPRFGFAPSPVIVGERVVFEVGGLEDEGLAAFDLATGDVEWTVLDGAAGSSTPVRASLGGVEQLVFHRRPEVVSVTPEGEVLWRHPSAPDAIVMPVVAPGDRIYVSAAAMGRGGVMLDVDLTGDGRWEVGEAWVQSRMRNHFHPAVLRDGTLYGFDNSTLRAVDADSGDLLWAKRGFGKGSVIAGGSFLFVLGDAGQLALVEATPEAYRERGRVQALEGRTWTAPSLGGSRLVVRDHDELVAYDVSRESTESRAQSQTSASAASEDSTSASSTSEHSTSKDLTALVDRYETARGGTEAWAAVQSLRRTGIWSTFSVPAPFEWIHQRGEGSRSADRYWLRHSMLGHTFDRGRDAEGFWLRSALYEVSEPSPVELPGVEPQLEIEAALEPALIRWEEKEMRVSWIGEGDLDGRPVLSVRLVRPGDGPEERRTEVWHLDPLTGLEVAIDSSVVDPTQRMEPFPRRTWFEDFRRVGDLVIPHRISHEFGARLEVLDVAEVEVNPSLEESSLIRAIAVTRP